MQHTKTAFVFPGQGAQYVGMGKDFYEQIPEAAEMFRLATKASGVDVEGICFKQNEEINITEYTQIAMLAAEVATWKVLDLKGIKADVCAGLSLGEYGALAACDVMDLADLFKVVYDFHDCLLTYTVERSKQWSVMLYPTIGRTSQILTSSVSLLM